MVYNYNREKHAFDQRWTYLRKAYSHAGMSETAIADIYINLTKRNSTVHAEKENTLWSVLTVLILKKEAAVWICLHLATTPVIPIQPSPKNMPGLTRFRTKHCMAVSCSCPVMIKSC